MGRSQLHKVRVQGISSDGRVQPALNPSSDHKLVDQTSVVDVADSYVFAADAFSTPAGTTPLTYTISAPPGFSIDSATRTISWTKDTAGEYRVDVYATNAAGKMVSEHFMVTVTEE